MVLILFYENLSRLNYMAVSIDKIFPAISSGLGVLATSTSAGYLKKQEYMVLMHIPVCSGTESLAANGSLPTWFWTGAYSLVSHKKELPIANWFF